MDASSSRISFPKPALRLLAATLAAIWLIGATHLFLWALVHPGEELIHGHDDRRYFSLAHSIWVDGDLDMTNEFERLAPESLEERTPIGRMANKYGVGMPLLSGPAMLFVRLLDLDTLERGSQAIFVLSNALLGLAGIALGALAVSRATSPWAGTLAAVALALGSSAFWYVGLQPSMAHAAGLFCSGLLFLGWERRYLGGDPRLRWLALMGLAAGLGAATRMQDAPIVLVAGFAELLWLKDWKSLASWREAFIAMLVFGACALAGVFPQLLHQKLLWGSWMMNAYAQGGERFHWLDPQAGPLLFSTRNSLFFYSPLSLLALGGLLFALGKKTLGQNAESDAAVSESRLALVRQETKRRGRVVWALLLVFGVNLYINSTWHAWWMGASFGARGLLNCWIPLVFGLAALFHDASRRSKGYRVALGVVVGACVAWTILMMTLYYCAAIPHEGEGFSPLSIPGRAIETISRLGAKLAKLA